MDLITVPQYKAFKGISGSTEDTKLNIIVPAISSLIKNYCGKTFIDYFATDKVEFYSLKWPQNVVFLGETPVISVTYVKEVEEGVSTTLLSSQYTVDTGLSAIYRIEDYIRTDYPEGINSVEVAYKAGYATTPLDLKLAVFDLVTYYLKDEYKPEVNHASFTIRNSNSEPDFPDHIKRVLDLYRDG